MNTIIDFTPAQQKTRKKTTNDTLGNNTKFASPDENGEQRDFIYRLSLQSHAQALAPTERVRICLRNKRKDSDNVKLIVDNDNKARFDGLMVCRSVWLCPVCSKRIMTERASALESGLNKASALGYESYLMTLTIKHSPYDRLDSLLDAMTRAYRYMFSGKTGRALKDELSYIGSIRALEIRGSVIRGWHPHFHIVVLSSVALSNIDELKLRLSQRWKQALNHVGRDSDLEIGLDFRQSKAKLFDYLTKQASMSHEIANPYAKKSSVSYSPMELLDNSHNGDLESRGLWKEYAHAIKGQKFITYSKGLKDLLGIGETLESETPTQEEITPYAIFNKHIWYQIRKHKQDLRAELIKLSKSGEVSVIIDMLVSRGVLWLDEAMTIHPKHPINHMDKNSYEYYEAMRYFSRESIIRF